MDEPSSGQVQDKQKVWLEEIIAKFNGLFEVEVSDNDQRVYVNGILKGNLLENETLNQQAEHNSKKQFTNSPDLRKALSDAAIDGFDPHALMSKQLLGSEKIQAAILEVLLGPAQLYAPRRKAEVLLRPEVGS